MLEKLLTTTPTAAKLWLLYIRYIFQFMHTCVTEFQEAGQRMFNKVKLVGANEHRYLVKCCFAKSTIINMWNAVCIYITVKSTFPLLLGVLNS